MATPKRSLDVVSATTLVAASMIGVGVYTTSGFTLTALGSPERVVAAWIVGGLIAICGAIGYASLAAKFTESGGEYLFLRKTLHPVAGLMAGWVSLLAGFTGAIAIAAIGLEKYFPPLINETTLPEGSIAIATVFLAATLHTIGVRSAARIQDAFVVVKLLMITGFIIFAWTQFGNWAGLIETDATTLAGEGDSASSAYLDFANQLVWISFSYAGFNAAVYISGEIKDPGRNVPLALVGGTVLVTLIYVLLNIIFVYAPTVGEITQSEESQVQIAATAANAIGGSSFASFVRFVIVISLFTSVSALVMTGPRVYAKMADDGCLPRWFRFDNRPPVQAIWFQASIAAIAISFTSLKELLGYLGLTLSLCSALTVSMLFLLRLKGDSIKLIGFGIPAAFYVIATLLLAVLYGIRSPNQAMAAGLTVLLGLILYPVLRNRISTPDSSHQDA
ncbi:MAG: APC family permease [Rubripirellula sp.]